MFGSGCYYKMDEKKDVVGSGDEKDSYNYEDLIVWQKAMDLVEAVYLNSKNFPKSEAYGLTSQLRRAVLSVPLNIAGRSAYP